MVVNRISKMGARGGGGGRGGRGSGAGGNRMYSLTDKTVKNTGRKAGYEIYHSNTSASAGGGVSKGGYFVLSHDGRTKQVGYIMGDKVNRPKIDRSPTFKYKADAVKYAKSLGLPSLNPKVIRV